MWETDFGREPSLEPNLKFLFRALTVTAERTPHLGDVYETVARPTCRCIRELRPRARDKNFPSFERSWNPVYLSLCLMRMDRIERDGSNTSPLLAAEGVSGQAIRQFEMYGLQLRRLLLVRQS